MGSAVYISKKSPGNADVAIWRAHFENIWANLAEPLGRVTAPNFHGVFDVCSWASECLVLGKVPQGTAQWAMLCCFIVTITDHQALIHLLLGSLSSQPEPSFF